MEKHSYASIVKKIQNGHYAPVYWLESEEPFFIDSIVDLLRKQAIPEEAQDFNQWVLYGKEYTMEDLLTRAKQFPMGSDRKLLILRQAQQMASWQQKEAIQCFSEYLCNPAPFTLLVFCIHMLPRSSFLPNKTLRDLLKKHSIYFQSKKIYENKLPEWIHHYTHSKGYSLTPKATALLCESIGNNLQIIIQELEKLMSTHPLNTTIEDHHIEQQVGISKDFNVLELQKALGTLQHRKAYQIVTYLSTSARGPVGLILGMLFQYFLRLAQYKCLSQKYRGTQLAHRLGIHPYFLREYEQAAQQHTWEKIWKNIRLIQRTDLKIKGLLGQSPQEAPLLKELVYRLMH